jgi:hypothetical protein
MYVIQLKRGQYFKQLGYMTDGKTSLRLATRFDTVEKAQAVVQLHKLHVQWCPKIKEVHNV